MTVSLYLNHHTWVHRLDGRTKILVVLAFFMLALCFSHPGYLLSALGLVLVGLGVAQAGVNVRKIWALAALLVCYSIVLWPFFVEGKNPIPGLQFLGVTWEGSMFGLGMGIRLLIMVWGGVWLLSTTTIEELNQAAQQLGMPSRVAFAFALAFRWVGILLGAGVGVLQAQRSRGLDISSGSIIERVRKYVPLVVPLIGHALRQTNLLAMALESKGFHPTAHRSFHLTGKMKRSDFAVLIFVFLLLGVSGWMRWQGIGTLEVIF
jgi:energy-coupling factor transport system permease protein